MTSFPSPNDVTRPCPLRPSTHCYDIVACHDDAFEFDNAKNVWGSCLVQNVQARGMIELIPMVKMETIHPVGGSFGNEFPSICNHCGVMVA